MATKKGTFGALLDAKLNFTVIKSVVKGPKNFVGKANEYSILAYKTDKEKYVDLGFKNWCSTNETSENLYIVSEMTEAMISNFQKHLKEGTFEEQLKNEDGTIYKIKGRRFEQRQKILLSDKDRLLSLLKQEKIDIEECLRIIDKLDKYYHLNLCIVNVPETLDRMIKDLEKNNQGYNTTLRKIYSYLVNLKK